MRRFRFRRFVQTADSDEADTVSVLNASTDHVLGNDRMAGKSPSKCSNGWQADPDGATEAGRGSGSSSQWNCDGEVITDEDITVE